MSLCRTSASCLPIAAPSPCLSLPNVDCKIRKVSSHRFIRFQVTLMLTMAAVMVFFVPGFRSQRMKTNGGCLKGIFQIASVWLPLLPFTTGWLPSCPKMYFAPAMLLKLAQTSSTVTLGVAGDSLAGLSTMLSSEHPGGGYFAVGKQCGTCLGSAKASGSPASNPVSLSTHLPLAALEQSPDRQWSTGTAAHTSPVLHPLPDILQSFPRSASGRVIVGTVI